VEAGLRRVGVSRRDIVARRTAIDGTARPYDHTLGTRNGRGARQFRIPEHTVETLSFGDDGNVVRSEESDAGEKYLGRACGGNVVPRELEDVVDGKRFVRHAAQDDDPSAGIAEVPSFYAELG
jgi:hypothetical protein